MASLHGARYLHFCALERPTNLLKSKSVQGNKKVVGGMKIISKTQGETLARRTIANDGILLCGPMNLLAYTYEYEK